MVFGTLEWNIRYRLFDGISFSTLHELRESNPFRVINGHININSIRNKSEPPKEWYKII